MTKIFVLPAQKRNSKLLNEISEAAKKSTLVVVFPKSKAIDFQPPEPPPLVA